MIRLKGQFEGWTVDDEKGMIYDDGNNSYSIQEVRSLFFVNQLHRTLTGHDFQVRSLKTQLNEKIKAAECPTIRINWGDGTEQIIAHPKFG